MKNERFNKKAKNLEMSLAAGDSTEAARLARETQEDLQHRINSLIYAKYNRPFYHEVVGKKELKQTRRQEKHLMRLIQDTKFNN